MTRASNVEETSENKQQGDDVPADEGRQRVHDHARRHDRAAAAHTRSVSRVSYGVCSWITSVYERRDTEPRRRR